MRKFLSSLTVMLLINVAGANTARPQNPYPDELPGFRFYAERLSPLRPYISDYNSVLRVFGSDQGLKLNGWRIAPTFVGKGGTINGRPWARDISGRLASIDIIPERRVSMLSVKFPPAFKHSIGGVSEINIGFDVYRDKYGLEYWVHSEDSAYGAKGDLWRIVYGPSKQIARQVTGQ
jgi:hypothetical protein